MKSKRLIIVGAGGFGREVHVWLEHWVACHEGWTIGGFIDDIKKELHGMSNYSCILSTIDDYKPGVDDYLVCAIATPRDKKKIVNELQEKGARFFTLIHPSAIVGKNVKVGEGSVICPFSILSVDLEVGSFATINSSCTIGHDVKIGDFVTLSGHCDVTGGVTLDDEVFLGSRVSILPNVRVGQRTIIGAGSVVIRSVAQDLTIFGVPAKRISG